MICSLFFKNTLLFSILLAAACGNSVNQNGKPEAVAKQQTNPEKPFAATKTMPDKIITGAENHQAYLPMLRGKKVGIVTNQTGIVTYYPAVPGLPANITTAKTAETSGSVVDFFLDNGIEVRTIFAPEHGFRGTADAGELIKDGKDTKTGLPIVSLYGSNKKPKPDQLKGIDVVVFDLQDVGARFYTYISSLHYVMEACAENGIPLIVLDRPNPNGGIVDGPTLEKQHSSFVGMHPIPVLHGMTMGEYAKMVNGEKWLKDGVQCMLTVVPCLNYSREAEYHLPVKPSPNLPNDQAINLYASLCFFEGTSVSLGRGTNKQFQVYGSPDLPNTGFSFTPMPNEGAKEPPLKGVVCYGEDLSKAAKVQRLELKWLIKAYRQTKNKEKFFIPFFTKLAGTEALQKQIVAGTDEEDIRRSWEPGLNRFREMRKKYLIYK